MKRKFIFKNHGTSLRIYKTIFGNWSFKENHLASGNKGFKTYLEAFKAMQRYSKRYYGEVAK